jgi:uncharacterized membrane protein
MRRLIPMMWWNHGGWGAGEWLAMSLMMLIVWSAVIALLVWLVGHISSARPTVEADSAAVSLAEEDSRTALLEREFADADPIKARAARTASSSHATAVHR